MCSDTHTYSTFVNIALLSNPSPLLPFLPAFSPWDKWTTPFYLLGDPSFGDHGANVHLHSSLVNDRLTTPCSLTLPSPPINTPSSCTCLQRRHHNISYTVWYIDSPLHDAAERFDSLLHDAAGSQTLNVITPQFETKFEKKLGYESGSKVGTSDEKKRRWKMSRYCPFKWASCCKLL